jgi:hypothetical protein
MIINTVFTGSSIRALNGLLATTVPPSRVCSTRDFYPNCDDFACSPNGFDEGLTR